PSCFLVLTQEVFDDGAIVIGRNDGLRRRGVAEFSLRPHCQQLARRFCMALQRLGTVFQQNYLLTSGVTEFAAFADLNMLFQDLIEIRPKTARSLWSATRIAGDARLKAVVAWWPAVTALAGIILAHWRVPFLRVVVMGIRGAARGNQARRCSLQA